MSTPLFLRWGFFFHNSFITSIRIRHTVLIGIRMTQSATVIYFGEQPYGYMVSRENDNYTFHPHLSDERVLPVLKIERNGSGWTAAGVDRDVEEQLIQLARIQDLLFSHSTASAAS